MNKSQYHVSRYVRCGHMPLYLIFCHNRYGQRRLCVMLCEHKNLKILLRQRRGFSNPKEYGRVLFNAYGSEPCSTLRSILKERFDFDLSRTTMTEARPAVAI